MKDKSLTFFLAFFLAHTAWATVMSNGATEIRNDSVNVAGREGKVGGVYFLTDSIAQASGVGIALNGSVWTIRGFPGILPVLPSQVSVPSPSHLSVVNGSSTTLSWVASVDPEGGAVSYTIFLSTNSTNLGAAVSIGQSALAFQTPALIVGATYFWRVDARSSDIMQGPLWQFFAGGGAPAAPNVTSGEGSLNGVNRRVTLGWSMSDPDGDPLTYTIFFGTFNPPTVATTTALSESFWKTGVLDYGKDYFWRVEGRDPVGNVTLGDVKTFVLANRSPSDPVIPEGMEGNIVSNVPEITLSWTVSDPDGDTMTSLLSMSEVSGGISVGAAPSFHSPFALSLSPHMAVLYEGGEQSYRAVLKYGVKYNWQVTAKDDAGGEKKGPVKSFVLVPPGGGRVKAVGGGEFRFGEGLLLLVDVKNPGATLRVIIKDSGGFTVAVAEEVVNNVQVGWNRVHWDVKTAGKRQLYTDVYSVYVFENDKRIGAIPVAGWQ